MIVHTVPPMAMAATATVVVAVTIARHIGIRSVRVRTGASVLIASCLATASMVAVSGSATGTTAASSSHSGAPHLHQAGSASRNPVVGMATTPTGGGYWMVASDGGIFAFGDAAFYGSTGNIHLNQPIVGMAATPDGHGYWLVASDGGIFAFGDAAFYGSAGNIHLNQPIVGIASTADGQGYWMVASDGGIFAYGDAAFYGSTGNIHLNQPIVGISTSPDGQGYRMVASDGGIFAYGDAAFYGSTGNIHLNQPIVGMSPTAGGHGYWMVASDGGLFAFGDAAFGGSMGGAVLSTPMVSVAVHRPGTGYWMVSRDGGVFSFSGAPFLGSLVTPATAGKSALGTPAANVPPSPNFLNACYPHNTSATCMTQVIQATTNARAAEGLGPMVLPGNFASLTPAQQSFVITDIERVDRGLAPFAGMVGALNADAQSGAQSNTDPTPSQVPAGMHVTAWASNWAENGNPLGSNYYWMYDDGVNSGNIDCTAAGQPGCWGHRQNILSMTDDQQLYGGTLLMGAGEAYGTTNTGWESDAELLVLASGPMPALSYSWDDAVAAGAR